MLFFLPSKRKDGLSRSADKYKHVCTEKRVTFALIFFVFPELTILWFHSDFRKALVCENRKAVLTNSFHKQKRKALPPSSSHPSQSGDSAAIELLRENEHAKELEKTEGNAVPVTDSAQFFTSRHGCF